MTVAVAADHARTKPQFFELAQLALSELRADGLVILDACTSPARVVAQEGPGADVQAGAEGGLLGLRPVRSDEDVVLSERAGCRLVSAPVTLEEGRPLGVMHAIFRGPLPSDDGEIRRLVRIFARHAGLILAYTRLRRERDRRAARAKWLDELDELAVTTRLDDMTERVTEALQPLTGATLSCIAIWDEERDILRALPGAFGATDRARAASITGPAGNSQSLTARVLMTGRPYMANDVDRDPGLHRAYADMFGIERLLGVPLSYGGRRIGVLVLANKPTDFTFADLRNVSDVSARIAMAVELARSVSRLQLQQRLEAIVATTAVAVATGRSVEDCMRPAFEELCATTDASVVGLVPCDGPSFLWRASDVPRALEQQLIDDGRGLMQRSVGAFPQAAGDPGWAALHAPVELYGERIAALSILRRNGEPFSSHEAAAVSRLANITALAWATERYQHQRAEIARLRERERIADELHDRVAQILFAAQLGLDSMLEGGAEVGLDPQRIREVSGLLTKGDVAIRDVINRLSAAADVKVARRLRLEVEGVEEEFGVAVHVELEDEDSINRVRRAVGDCMVKVAREGIVNAAKHAGPCRITLSVGRDARGRLILTVLDDGLGTPAAERRRDSHGLRQLRRAVKDAGGTLRMSRREGRFGTCLRATFPLDDQPAGR